MFFREGLILTKKMIFWPKGKRKTFAEMKPKKKYKIDHRYFAFKKLRKFL